MKSFSKLVAIIGLAALFLTPASGMASPEGDLDKAVTTVAGIKIQIDDLKKQGLTASNKEISMRQKKLDAAMSKIDELLSKGLNPASIKSAITGQDLVSFFKMKNKKMKLKMDDVVAKLEKAAAK